MMKEIDKVLFELEMNDSHSTREMNNLQVQLLCNEIRMSCDKMCDILDRIDNLGDKYNEDSRAE